MSKFILCVFMMSVCVVPVQAEEITVAAAANLQDTLEELVQKFQKETGITVQTVMGSSGKLTAQIENGAPFDVFMSADTDYPKTLHEKGLTAGEPRIYAYGKLVLWTFNEQVDLSKGLAVLKEEQVKKIALAAPKTAPYGRQAVKAMNQTRIYDEVSSKLVYGESISQANQFVVSQAADIGFTAKSVVLAPNMQGQGKWIEVPGEFYEPIAQSAVILAGSNHPAAAQKFYDFLFSAPAQNIFRKYGYQLP